jgi:hypothetical protein
MLSKEYVLVQHLIEDFKNGGNQVFLIGSGQDRYKNMIPGKESEGTGNHLIVYL